MREGVAGHDYGIGADQAILMPKPYRVPIDADAEAWNTSITAIVGYVQEHVGRGPARDLHRQLRLAIEEYR